MWLVGVEDILVGFLFPKMQWWSEELTELVSSHTFWVTLPPTSERVSDAASIALGCSLPPFEDSAVPEPVIPLVAFLGSFLHVQMCWDDLHGITCNVANPIIKLKIWRVDVTYFCWNWGWFIGCTTLFRMQLGHALLYALEICFKSEWVIPHPQI